MNTEIKLQILLENLKHTTICKYWKFEQSPESTSKFPTVKMLCKRANPETLTSCGGDIGKCEIEEL